MMSHLPTLIRDLDWWHGAWWLIIPVVFVGLCAGLLIGASLDVRSSVLERVPDWQLKLIRGRRFRDALALAAGVMFVVGFAVAPLCQRLLHTSSRIDVRNAVFTIPVLLWGVARVNEGRIVLGRRRANRPAAEQEAADRIKKGIHP